MTVAMDEMDVMYLTKSKRKVKKCRQYDRQSRLGTVWVAQTLQNSSLRWRLVDCVLYWFRTSVAMSISLLYDSVEWSLEKWVVIPSCL